MDIPFIEKLKNIEHAYESLQYRKVAHGLKELWASGNEYISKTQPWSVIKEDKAKAGHILATCLQLASIYAVAAYPVIPSTSKKIFNLLGLSICPSSVTLEQAMLFNLLPKEGVVSDKISLFEKIDTDTVNKLSAEYQGNCLL